MNKTELESFALGLRGKAIFGFIHKALYSSSFGLNCLIVQKMGFVAQN